MKSHQVMTQLIGLIPNLENLRSHDPQEIARALEVTTSEDFGLLITFLKGVETAHVEMGLALQGMGGADPSGQVGPMTDQVLPPSGPGVVQGIMRPKNVALHGAEKKDAEKVRGVEQRQEGNNPEEQTNEGDITAPSITEMNLINHPMHVNQVYTAPEHSPAPWQQPSGIDDQERDYGDDNDQSASSQVMMDDGEERLPLAKMAQKWGTQSGILRAKLQEGMTDREALGLDNNEQEDTPEEQPDQEGPWQEQPEQPEQVESSAAFPNGNLDGSPPDDELQYGDPIRRDNESSPATEAVRRNLPYGESLNNDTMPLTDDMNDQPLDMPRGTKPDPDEDINNPEPFEYATSSEGDPVNHNPDAPDGFPPYDENEDNSQLTRGPSQSGTADTDFGKGPDMSDGPQGLDSDLRDQQLPDPNFQIDERGVV